MHDRSLLRSVPVLVVLTLLAIAGRCFAGESPWLKRLPFQHATISYEITGAEIGRETLALKDYGRYRAKTHDGISSAFGISNRTLSLEITDPDFHYIFDLVAKTGTRAVNPVKYLNEEFARLPPAGQDNVRKNMETLGLTMAREFQGETVTKATKILGFDCDRTTIMGMTIDGIHGSDVVLRTTMNLMGMETSITATAIDTGAPADTAFALPPDITPVQDERADALSLQMAKDMVTILKEADGAAKLRAKWRSGKVGMEGTAPQATGSGSAPQGK